MVNESRKGKASADPTGSHYSVLGVETSVRGFSSHADIRSLACCVQGVPLAPAVPFDVSTSLPHSKILEQLGLIHYLQLSDQTCSAHRS